MVNTNWSIKTKHLFIRPALPDNIDCNFLLKLWTNPQVMKYVGFPKGDVSTNLNKIRDYLNEAESDCYDRVLLVCLSDKTMIGECKLCLPDENRIAHTDLKLESEYWGNHYGQEIKQALVDYLFSNTDCDGVKGTPNRNNIASIKMQEAVGGTKMKEGIFHFPDSMRKFTEDVPYFEYIVTRETWQKNKA